MVIETKQNTFAVVLETGRIIKYEMFPIGKCNYQEIVRVKRIRNSVTFVCRSLRNFNNDFVVVDLNC